MSEPEGDSARSKQKLDKLCADAQRQSELLKNLRSRIQTGSAANPLLSTWGTGSPSKPAGTQLSSSAKFDSSSFLSGALLTATPTAASPAPTSSPLSMSSLTAPSQNPPQAAATTSTPTDAVTSSGPSDRELELQTRLTETEDKMKRLAMAYKKLKTEHTASSGATQRVAALEAELAQQKAATAEAERARDEANQVHAHSQAEQHASRMEALEAELAGIRERAELALEDADRHRKLAEEAGAELAAMHSQMEQLREEAEEKNDRAQLLEQCLSERNDENAELRSRAERDHKEARESVEATLTSLQAAATQAQQQCDELARQLADAEDENASLHSTISMMHAASQLHPHEAELAQLQAELDTKRTYIAELEESWQRGETQRQSEADEWQAQARTAEARAQEVQSLLETASGEVKTLREHVATVEAECARLREAQGQAAALNSAVTQQVQELENEIKNTREEEVSLRETLAALQKEAAESSQALASSKERMSEFWSQLQDAERKRAESERQKEELQQRLAEANGIGGSACEELERMRKRVDAIEAELEAEQRQSAEMAKKNTELGASLEAAEENAAAQVAELEKLHSEMIALREQATNATDQVSAIEAHARVAIEGAAAMEKENDQWKAKARKLAEMVCQLKHLAQRERSAKEAVEKSQADATSAWEEERSGLLKQLADTEGAEGALKMEKGAWARERAELEQQLATLCAESDERLKAANSQASDAMEKLAVLESTIAQHRVELEARVAALENDLEIAQRQGASAADERVAALEAQLQASTQQQEQLSAEISAKAEELTGLSAELADTRVGLAELQESSRERVEAAEVRAAQAEAQAHSEARAAQAQAQAHSEARAAQAQAATRAAQAEAEATELLASKDEEICGLADELASTRSALAEANSSMSERVATLEARLFEQEAERAALVQQLEAKDTELAGHRDNVQRLQAAAADKARLEEEQRVLMERVTRFEQQLVVREEEVVALRKSEGLLEEANHRLQAAMARDEELTVQCQQLVSEKAQLAAELERLHAQTVPAAVNSVDGEEVERLRAALAEAHDETELLRAALKVHEEALDSAHAELQAARDEAASLEQAPTPNGISSPPHSPQIVSAMPAETQHYALWLAHHAANAMETRDRSQSDTALIHNPRHAQNGVVENGVDDDELVRLREEVKEQEAALRDQALKAVAVQEELVQIMSVVAEAKVASALTAAQHSRAEEEWDSEVKLLRTALAESEERLREALVCARPGEQEAADVLRREVDTSHARIAELETSNAEQLIKLQTVGKAYRKLKDDFAASQHEIEALRSELARVQATQQQLAMEGQASEALTAAQAEIEELRRQPPRESAPDTRLQKVAGAYKKVKLELAAATQEIAELRHQVQALEATNAQLASDLGSLGQLQERTQTLEATNDSLTEQMEVLKQQLQGQEVVHTDPQTGFTYVSPAEQSDETVRVLMEQNDGLRRELEAAITTSATQAARVSQLEAYVHALSDAAGSTNHVPDHASESVEGGYEGAPPLQQVSTEGEWGAEHYSAVSTPLDSGDSQDMKSDPFGFFEQLPQAATPPVEPLVEPLVESDPQPPQLAASMHYDPFDFSGPVQPEPEHMVATGPLAESPPPLQQYDPFKFSGQPVQAAEPEQFVPTQTEQPPPHQYDPFDFSGSHTSMQQVDSREAGQTGEDKEDSFDFFPNQLSSGEPPVPSTGEQPYDPFDFSYGPQAEIPEPAPLLREHSEAFDEAEALRRNSSHSEPVIDPSAAISAHSSRASSPTPPDPVVEDEQPSTLPPSPSEEPTPISRPPTPDEPSQSDGSEVRQRRVLAPVSREKGPEEVAEEESDRRASQARPQPTVARNIKVSLLTMVSPIIVGAGVMAIGMADWDLSGFMPGNF